MNTDNKVALVTGGTGGIGREICLRLQADGYGVVAADLAVEEAENGNPMPDAPEGITIHQIDIRNRDSIAKCVGYAAGLGMASGACELRRNPPPWQSRGHHRRGNEHGLGRECRRHDPRVFGGPSGICVPGRRS